MSITIPGFTDAVHGLDQVNKKLATKGVSKKNKAILRNQQRGWASVVNRGLTQLGDVGAIREQAQKALSAAGVGVAAPVHENAKNLKQKIQPALAPLKIAQQENIAPAAAHIPARPSNLGRNLGILTTMGAVGLAVAYYFNPIKETVVGLGNSAMAFATSNSTQSAINFGTQALTTVSNAKNGTLTKVGDIIGRTAAFGKTVFNAGTNSTGFVESASKIATAAISAYPFTAAQTLIGLGAVITTITVAKMIINCCKGSQPAPAQQQQQQPDPVLAGQPAPAQQQQQQPDPVLAGQPAVDDNNTLLIDPSLFN